MNKKIDEFTLINMINKLREYELITEIQANNIINKNRRVEVVK